ETQSADGEILHRARCRGTVVHVGRDLHLTERVSFHPCHRPHQPSPCPLPSGEGNMVGRCRALTLLCPRACRRDAAAAAAGARRGARCPLPGCAGPRANRGGTNARTAGYTVMRRPERGAWWRRTCPRRGGPRPPRGSPAPAAPRARIGGSRIAHPPARVRRGGGRPVGGPRRRWGL